MSFSDVRFITSISFRQVLLQSNKFPNGFNGNDNQHDSIIIPNKINSMQEVDCMTSCKKSAQSIVCQNVIKAASEFDGNKCVHESNVYPNVIEEVPEFGCVNSGHKSNIFPNVIKAVPVFDDGLHTCSDVSKVF